MRIAGIVEESFVDGPGIRYAVFVQGCPHRCSSCHNPQTHDPAAGEEAPAEEIAASLERAFAANPLLDGVTFTGGEPLAQAQALLPLARRARALGLSLWIYTGYTAEEIAETDDPGVLALLDFADVLVDGRYEEGRRTLERPFVGSANQRTIPEPGLYIRTMRTEPSRVKLFPSVAGHHKRPDDTNEG